MSLFGSSSKTKNRIWAPARRPTVDHVDMLKGQDPWTLAPGEGVAGFNPDQQQAFENIRQNAGYGAGQGMMGQGQGMLGHYGQAGNFYGGALGSGPVQNQGIDMGYASGLVNNDLLNGQIDAVNRDVTRGLTEGALPGIAAYSAGSGNLGSSRRGMQEGMAIRGAQDRMADNAASMRGNAYNQALGYANQLAGQNAGFEQMNRDYQMGAANQLANLGNAGAGLMGQGYGMMNQGNQQLLGIGNQQQGLNQQQLDWNQQQHYMGQQLPYQQAAMGLGTLQPVGSAYGYTSNSSNPSVGGMLLNAGAQLGGAALTGGMNMAMPAMMGGSGGISFNGQPGGGYNPFPTFPTF